MQSNKIINNITIIMPRLLISSSALVGKQYLILNLGYSSVTSLSRPISFKIQRCTIMHVSLNNKDIEKKLLKPTNFTLQILNIITEAEKQQHIKEKILTMDKPKLFTIYNAKKDINKLINASKQFLNDFFSQIDLLITKDIDVYIKTNKEKQGISVSYKKIEDLLKAIKKKQLQHDYVWFDSIIKTLNDFLSSFADIEQIFIKQNIIKNHDKKDFYKIFLEDFKNQLINWKKEIFHKMKNAEIVSLIKQQLNTINDKAFVNYFNNIINNQEINLNLISIMFEDIHKKDFTNLTKEQHTHYITFMDSILLSYGSKDNLLKIMVDPSKGLIALCFYSYSKKETQRANFNTLINILVKFNNYLIASSNNKYFVNSMTLKDFKKYETEIFNLISNRVKNPEQEHDTLQKRLDDKGKILSDEIDLILQNQNTKRNYFKQLDIVAQKMAIKYEIMTDRVLNLITKTVLLERLNAKKTKWVHELNLNRNKHSTYFTDEIKDQVFLDYLMGKNLEKKHESAGNLLSFLFGHRKIIFISDLSYRQIKLLVDYFTQTFTQTYTSLEMFEDFSFKILCDFYGGMGLIRYYIFDKKNNEMLTKNELNEIKQSFIDFQFKHDIEIFHDFTAK